MARSFTGTIEQVPPSFAALKHKGKKFYELAREGKEVPERPRKVLVKSFEIIEYKPPEINFRAIVGRGVYLRSLANDFGQKLDCGGCLSSLARIRIGSFRLSEAIDPPQSLEVLVKGLRPAAELITHLPKIANFDIERVRKGQDFPNTEKLADTMVVQLLDDQDSFLAIGQVAGEKIRPRRIIHDGK